MASGMEFVEAQIVDQHHDDVRTLAARSAGWRRFRRVPVSAGGGGDEEEAEEHTASESDHLVHLEGCIYA